MTESDIRDSGAVARRLGEAVAARSVALARAAARDLALPADDMAAEVDLTLTYVRRNLAREVNSMVAGRRAICASGQEAALMLPSNMTTFAIVEIARTVLGGNSVRARFTRRAQSVAQLVQDVFDDVVPGAVRVDKDSTGPEFLHCAIGSDTVPLVMVWGGEALGDELLSRLADTPSKRIVFEGPGKDPVLVLPGADPRDVAAQLIGAKFVLG